MTELNKTDFQRIPPKPEGETNNVKNVQDEVLVTDPKLEELHAAYHECVKDRMGYRYTVGGVILAIPTCFVLS